MPANSNHPLFRKRGSGTPAPHDEPNRFAYRGYLVTRDFTGRTYYVTKDGVNIGSSGSAAGARTIIDGITG